ncbi:hypothetical protein ACFLQW_04570 [Candidatus Zixiibacteriota bacterium]
MKAERDIEKKIRQKEEEVNQLKQQLMQAEAELKGWQGSLRLIQRTTAGNGGGVIRPGSLVYQARSVLLKEGKPMHIKALLAKMGKEITKKNRVSLSGSLGGYVRQNYIFTRPAPNTFGLMQFGEGQENEDIIPEAFGRDE